MMNCCYYERNREPSMISVASESVYHRPICQSERQRQQLDGRLPGAVRNRRNVLTELGSWTRKSSGELRLTIKLGAPEVLRLRLRVSFQWPLALQFVARRFVG